MEREREMEKRSEAQSSQPEPWVTKGRQTQLSQALKRKNGQKGHGARIHLVLTWRLRQKMPTYSSTLGWASDFSRSTSLMNVARLACSRLSSFSTSAWPLRRWRARYTRPKYPSASTLPHSMSVRQSSREANASTVVVLVVSPSPISWQEARARAKYSCR